MYSQHANKRRALIKVGIFCISGLIVIPMMLRDCSEALDFHSSKPVSFDRASYYRSPNGTDIIGTWVPDETTAELLKRDGAYLKTNPANPPHIEFKKDYTFKFTNMPNVLEKEDQELLFTTSEGSWNIYQSGAGWNVHLYSDGKENKADFLGIRPPYQSQIVLKWEESNRSKTLTFIKSR